MELKLAQIEKLKEIASQQIPEQDYQQQIDRWNEYQTILDGIEKMILDKKLNAVGVSLRKNIETSLQREQTETELRRFGTVMYTPSFYLQEPVYQKPEEPKESTDITFTCKPEIHIDEFQYMNRYIKNIPQINKDPIINLPHIEMTIPKAWIAQNSLLDVMNELNNPNISQDLVDMEAKQQHNIRTASLHTGVFV